MQDGPSIPWPLAERIYWVYVDLFGEEQTLERLAQRGGLSWTEIPVLRQQYYRKHGWLPDWRSTLGDVKPTPEEVLAKYDADHHHHKAWLFECIVNLRAALALALSELEAVKAREEALIRLAAVLGLAMDERGYLRAQADEEWRALHPDLTEAIEAAEEEILAASEPPGEEGT
jgi:hypothetical protein